MPDRIRSTRIVRYGAALVATVWLAATAVAAPAVPALTGRVVDTAGLLTASGRGRVEQAIVQFEAATRGQMAVLTIPSLEGESIEQYSIRVAEKWKIGAKDQDTGAILVVARDDRAMRIEVGYGWEGQINDARAGDVIRGMQPLFRAGRFDDGILYAVGQLQGYVTGQAVAEVPAAPSPGHGSATGPPAWVVLLVLLIVILAALGNMASARRHGGMVIYHGGSYGRGFGGGGLRSGGFGGGFGGGGGSFGGGGASGRW
jgi:uncharacterized protein